MLAARDQWLRVGWPRAVLLLLLPAPALVAGPLRVITGIGLGTALAVAFAASVLPLVALWPALRRSGLPPRREVALTVVAAVVALFAAALPYNRQFHGLAGYAAADGWMGVDGGYHVMYFFDFTRTRTVYHDFVALYSFWDLFRRLGSRHLIVAVNASLIFARVVVALVPCLVAFSVLHAFREDRRAWWAGVAACLIASIGIGYAIVLPLETFHAMGGFWSHLFGMIVLMGLWLADVLVRPRALRIVALLGGVALCRYTYGLNLADLFAVAGAILVAEAAGRALPLWTRLLLVVAATGAFFAARHAFHLAAPLIYVWGWIVAHDVVATGKGLGVALAVFAATLCMPTARSAGAGSGITRALRFPLLFGLASALMLHYLRAQPTGTFYYIVKYDQNAIVVVAGGAVVVVTFWTAACVRRPRLVTVGGALALLLLLALGLGRVQRTLEPYAEGFHEQVFGGELRRSQPWVIPEVVAHMQLMLDRGNKRFGGYVSPNLPMLIFTNAVFDHASLEWLQNRRLHDIPGTCVFWDGGRDSYWDGRREKECARYEQAPWGQLEVCGACF